MATRIETDEFILRGVSFFDGKHWVAVCLDHYLVTYASSESKLKTAILRMLESHIAACLELGRTPFEGLPRAPEEYWKKYEKAAQVPSIRPPDGLYQVRFPEIRLRRAA